MIWKLKSLNKKAAFSTVQLVTEQFQGWSLAGEGIGSNSIFADIFTDIPGLIQTYDFLSSVLIMIWKLKSLNKRATFLTVQLGTEQGACLILACWVM